MIIPPPSSRSPKENLDAVGEAMDRVVFSKIFTAEQIERYQNGDQHYYISVPRGGDKYDEYGRKGYDLPGGGKKYSQYGSDINTDAKTSEERAQEVNTGLQSFSMHSFIMPLQKEGVITESDVGPLIQFGLKNMKVMILMGDPDYGK